MPLIRFLFVAVPVIRRFLRSRQGKAAIAKGKAQMAKRSQKRPRAAGPRAARSPGPAAPRSPAAPGSTRRS
jgi:hypothetical protein